MLNSRDLRVLAFVHVGKNATESLLIKYITMFNLSPALVLSGLSVFKVVEKSLKIIQIPDRPSISETVRNIKKIG